MGNQAAQRLLRSGTIQPKLTINQPGDQFEQEADRIADTVMRMPDPGGAPNVISQVGSIAKIQRAGACGASGGATRECLECQAAESLGLQRTAGPASPVASVPPIVHNVLRSPGQPLDTASRGFMESRFGADFSTVRVHTDSQATDSARAINAFAYTVGRDIIFGADKYAPHTQAGQKLLAHELAHVVQQGAMPGVGPVQRLCGPKQIGKVPPKDCTLVSAQPTGNRFMFNVNCDTLAPGQEIALEEFVKAIPKESKIDILGMASAEGDPGFNESLSCHRANTVASFLHAKGLGSNIRFIRATGGVPGTENDPNFRAVDIAIIEPTIHGIKVVAKSFIAPIGSRIGSAPCFFPLPVPPSQRITSSQERLKLLAAATDLNFSENPLTDLKDKAYRLYSERTFSVACLEGTISSVSPSVLDTDAGKEGPLQPPPLITSGVTAKVTGPATFSFSWTAKGKPHPAAEPAFQAVCPRDSVFIWHKVEGEIDCSVLRFTGLTPIVGSEFPSHRVFVDGVAKAPTVPQGPYSNLWVSDPSDPTLVK